MGKNNVNPNHYKIAGRDRQGEDILQARNKQKLALSQARERFEPRQQLASEPPPAPRPEEPAREKTTPERTTAAGRAGRSGSGTAKKRASSGTRR